MEDKKNLLTTSDTLGKVEKTDPAVAEAKVDSTVVTPTVDSVVDDWFSIVKKQLSRDTATRNILHNALPALKTALNEVKA